MFFKLYKIQGSIGLLIVNGNIKERGVIPPELIAKDRNNVRFIEKYLNNYDNIKIFK
ncbi:MAG: hypothetical protein J7L07_07475 [Candidatus Odinarchaeota archaeon]|nr:hypothetical protein [Candidatus Odinarchaeota archaeon]